MQTIYPFKMLYLVKFLSSIADNFNMPISLIAFFRSFKINLNFAKKCNAVESTCEFIRINTTSLLLDIEF